MDAGYDAKGLMSPMNHSFTSFRSAKDEAKMQIYDTTSIAMSGKGFVFNDVASDKGAHERPALKKATPVELAFVEFDEAMNI